MAYEIAHAQEFPIELGRVPKKVRAAYLSLALPLLRTNPEVADPPRVKPLTGYRGLWRLRVGDDFRLVYRVDRDAKLVTLLMIDRRSTIYDRLGAAPDGSPGIRIVAKASELLERAPSEAQIGNAYIALATAAQPTQPLPDSPLPIALSGGLLTEWSVPVEFHCALVAARTEADLLALDARVPGNILERVMNGLWPPPLEEVVQKPMRVAEGPTALEHAAEGARSLDSFLLSLDADQKAFVARFESRDPQGPWLVKGGPGSGKSTVAIYCARAVLAQANASLSRTHPPRVLFTTYTKSLVSASRYLVRSLDHGDVQPSIEVRNIDSIASDFLSPDQRRIPIADHRTLRETMEHSTQAVRGRKPNLALASVDSEYLLDEIDWVIIGQGIATLDEYLGVDRGGRGKALSPPQRRDLWEVYEEFRGQLRAKRLQLFSERLATALEQATPQFDFVFVDEAQDLKPIALRLCVKLCRSPARVFLAADPNQSIYGSGMSWSTVSSALRFSGRARVLRRNFRTTREIWRAVQQLVPEAASADAETLEAEPVYSGPWPGYVSVRDRAALKEALNEYLFEALRSERLSPGCAAVLCPTNRALEETESLIDRSLRPRAMSSAEVDLGHPGVKLMTMHAAKGLQFPVVAIVGLRQGQLPSAPSSAAMADDHELRQRRLLFVACTRAIRRLKLFGDSVQPSQFASRITDECWDVEER